MLYFYCVIYCEQIFLSVYAWILLNFCFLFVSFSQSDSTYTNNTKNIAFSCNSRSKVNIGVMFRKTAPYLIQCMYIILSEAVYITMYAESVLKITFCRIVINCSYVLFEFSFQSPKTSFY